MLTCIFVDLQVFYSHSWKSRLLVAFLVLSVVFFMLGWSYFGRIFTKSRSSFGRLFSNIWSYFYLTTLLQAACDQDLLCRVCDAGDLDTLNTEAKLLVQMKMLAVHVFPRKFNWAVPIQVAMHPVSVML